MLNIFLHGALISVCVAATSNTEQYVGYVLPTSCPPIDRQRLLNDFMIWSISSLPACMLIFLVCRFAHGWFARPAAYRRYVNDEGDCVETCRLFTELEAIDPKENAAPEVHQARLRVHPSSRRRVHRGKPEMDPLISAMEAALTARPKVTKKRSRKRQSKRTLLMTDEDEDITQPSTQTLSKTQTFSPVSSEIYRSTVPSSVLPGDSGSNPATPLADAIPTALPQYGHYGYIPHRQQQQQPPQPQQPRGGPHNVTSTKQNSKPTGVNGVNRHATGPNYMARLQDAILSRANRPTEPSVVAAQHRLTDATSNPDQRNMNYKGTSRRRKGQEQKE